MWLTKISLPAAVVAVAAITAVATGSATGADAPSVGQPPPEWAANAGSWPAHNHDLANTRATTQTPINSQTVSKLRVRWSFPFKGSGAFGIFASTPIVLNGTVYLQDLNSNVYALDRSTGALKWRHAFNRPSVGPNGLAFGYGRVYGATERKLFALDPQTGKLVWTSRTLPRNANEGIDMTPQLYDGTVLISTIPGNVKSFYKGNGDGIVWAFDAVTGKTKWKFNTVGDGAKLWGNPKINSGGGLWYPPAVDSEGRVFISVANPAPLYGTKKFPNGSSRPGPNFYTSSIVALNGQTGKRIWFRQTVRHDVRDYDLQIPAITTTVPIGGVQTDIVLVAGKMGKAFAYRAADGKHLWTRSVGKHQNDTGPLPRKLVNIFPGDLGGVETPMALADNRLFVPWVDLPTRARSTGLPGGLAGQSPNFRKGRGGLTAVSPATGKVLWERKLPSMNFGAATVANDVVFTSTYGGTVYAFDTRTGKTLWTTKAPAGINAFPAIDGDTLLVGAGTPGFHKKPRFELIAYSLPEPTSASSEPHARASATTDRVSAKEFSFKLSAKSVATPRKVTFTVRNAGHVTHNFHISGRGTPNIQPGKTSRLVVRFRKSGRFRYLCTVPGHAAAGMRGVFTVR
jgi:outer membrane protein assembly factor BamB/plastocyanin